MTTYRTPDVYVEEISVFPPSVAEVGTAIPAFIGYTEKAKQRIDGDLILKPTKIYSLKEYEQLFGGPYSEKIEVSLTSNSAGGYDASIPSEPGTSYLLYHAVRMYFDNGGGQCYIVSVGAHGASIGLKGSTDAPPYGLQDGLDKVAEEDEPTMLVIPEAVKLGYGDYVTLAGKMIEQCKALGDRVAILDAWMGDAKPTEKFENGKTDDKNKAIEVDVIQGNREAWAGELKYAAAYYPFLRTTFNPHANERDVTVKFPESDEAKAAAAKRAVAEKAKDDAEKAKDDADAAQAAADADASDTAKAAAAQKAKDAADDAAKDAAAKDAEAKDAEALAEPSMDKLNNPSETAHYDTAAYNAVRAELKNHFVIMPPSGAVAGVYAATDRDRGVWKAPANVALADVLEPVVKLTNAVQDTLNVDTTGGKSINAIRAFAGKGTLVWGARTLAGNDNEWRYISVRRFFNMVEESIKKSTYWAVFEPNNANTWVKVRGMIENYLIDKWRDGALAGATPKDAFFVKCGMGTTMSSQDILEGRMNVEIGMAVARPAEFIVLKFSHKLQTS